jgi:hypothetical protein
MMKPEELFRVTFEAVLADGLRRVPGAAPDLESQVRVAERAWSVAEVAVARAWPGTAGAAKAASVEGHPTEPPATAEPPPHRIMHPPGDRFATPETVGMFSGPGVA